MNILFFASGHFAVPSLRWLHGSGHRVVRVVTQPDRPAGRGRRTSPTPVKAAAVELGLDVMAVENVNDPQVVDELLAAGADLGLAIAFGQKIGPRLLTGFPKGCLNLHASLLPKYRGAAPINHALLNGERETGLTVFRLAEKMDAGPILRARSVPIAPEENAGQLHDRLAELGPLLLDETLSLFAAGANPTGTVQDEAAATLAPKLRKADGRLDFHQPAEMLIRKVRAYTPWPGATCMFASARTGKTEPILVTKAHIAEGQADVSPGTILQDLTVAAGNGALRILELKPAASKTMSARDFINGRRVTAEDRFE